MKLSSAVAVWAMCVSGVAFAQGALSVQVGRSASRDIGIARGILCDDLSIAAVRIENVSASKNRFVATGLVPGETNCRVGLDQGGPTQVIHLVVTAAPTVSADAGIQ